MKAYDAEWWMLRHEGIIKNHFLTPVVFKTIADLRLRLAREIKGLRSRVAELEEQLRLSAQSRDEWRQRCLNSRSRVIRELADWAFQRRRNGEPPLDENTIRSLLPTHEDKTKGGTSGP